MDQLKPYWYSLIKLLKSKGIITTGLTIPYLIGAYKALGQPFDSISKLMDNILESKTDQYPVVQRCHVIGQHVVMLEKKEYCNKYYKKDVRFESSSKDNFLFISSNTDLGKNIERVCWNLAAEYERPIKDEEFSWNNQEKKWKKLSQNEIDLIISIK